MHIGKQLIYKSCCTAKCKHRTQLIVGRMIGFLVIQDPSTCTARLYPALHVVAAFSAAHFFIDQLISRQRSNVTGGEFDREV